MAQPLDVPRVLQQVPVDVFAEDDLLLHRDLRIEYTSSSPTSGAGSASRQTVPRARLEIGGAAPELVLLERFVVMQPHDLGGIISSRNSANR